MFEQTFVTKSSKKTGSLLASVLAQVGLAAAFIILPLIFYPGLPKVALASMLVAPNPPKPLPPPPEVPQAPPQKRVTKVFVPPCTTCAPPRIPTKPPSQDEPDLNVLPTPPGVDGAVPQGPRGPGILTEVPKVPPPPEKKREEAKEKPREIPRLRIGGMVDAPKLINKVQPQYTELARKARVQGTVIFTAVIDEDGNIRQLQLVTGNPLLVGPARDAVSRWRYSKPRLNGEPIQVVTQISVNFTLNQ